MGASKAYIYLNFFSSLFYSFAFISIFNNLLTIVNGKNTIDVFFFFPDNKLVGWWVQEWLVPLVSIVTKFYVDIENIIKYFYCKKYIFIWKFIQWYHINAQKWYCHSYFIITRVIHCQTKFHGNQCETLENFPPSLLIYIEILKL